MKRITYPTACVLQAIANGKVFGMDIIDHTGLPSGTVYPILRRLEREGLLVSDFETPEKAIAERRPKRRNYRLTKDGRNALGAVRKRYQQHLEVFGNVNVDVDTEPAR